MLAQVVRKAEKLTMPTPDSPSIMLSIVIPAFNEAQRLPETLARLRAFLAEQGWLAQTEVIVVDDGSTDGTLGVASRLRGGWPRLAVISLPHRGKGAAVRQGLLAARGEFVFFGDADFSMPVEQIVRFLPPASPMADLVIGSREALGARRFGEPSYRHVMGRVFNWLVKLLVLRGFDDTQCGFKRLTHDAAHVLAKELRLDGWSFDVELLALARVRGLTIAETPIDWHHECHSRVRPVRDTVRMLADVWRVRRRMRSMPRPTAAPEQPLEDPGIIPRPFPSVIGDGIVPKPFPSAIIQRTTRPS
jgi:dolichyl-phosphate beta-glucosyltransferase